MKIIRVAALVIFLSSMSLTAHAATTYQYMGNDFDTIFDDVGGVVAGMYTTSMSVMGEFSVSSALGPMLLTDISGMVTSYSFSDGRSTLTESNSAIDSFAVAIDGSGNISEWLIDVFISDFPVELDELLFSIRTFNVTLNVIDAGKVERCIDSNTQSCFDEAEDAGAVLNNAGAWSMSVVDVSEPGTLPLLLIGLFGVVWARRRKIT
jgi:hypothetical protein